MRDQGQGDCVCRRLAPDRYGVHSVHSEFCIEHGMRRSWDDRRDVMVIGLSLSLATEATQSTLRGRAANGMSGITTRGTGADSTSKTCTSRARGGEPDDRDSPDNAGDIPVGSSRSDYRVPRQPCSSRT